MTKERLLHVGLLFPLTAFLLHQLLQLAFKINLPFLDAYLDPFCAGALACYVISIERWYLFGVSRLSWIDAIVLILFFSVITEGLFPILSDRFVRDWGDVAAISLGVIWFMMTAGKD